MASAPIPLTDVSYTIVNQVAPSSAAAEQNPLQKFLKGEPKAMGVVQIMIALLIILFGIVMTFPAHNISVFSGVVFWGSLIHIIAGSLAVSASNKLNACVIRAALVLNILSTIAAGIAIIILSLDLVMDPVRYACYYDHGTYGCSYGYLALVVQAIIGVLVFIFGFANKDSDTVSGSSGVAFWGSIIFICSGILSAVNGDRCHGFLTKVSMAMNLFSTGGGVAATGLFSADLYELVNELKKLSIHDFKPFQVRAALVLNIFGTIAAGIAIIMLSQDLLFRSTFNDCYYYKCTYGCRYNYLAVLNIINVVQNPASGVPVVISNPAYQAQP
ncbi:membrane-spanning 4-domains subfamily A member 4A-like, partial [Clarias magur]